MVADCVGTVGVEGACGASGGACVEGSVAAVESVAVEPAWSAFGEVVATAAGVGGVGDVGSWTVARIESGGATAGKAEKGCGRGCQTPCCGSQERVAVSGVWVLEEGVNVTGAWDGSECGGAVGGGGWQGSAVGSAMG